MVEAVVQGIGPYQVTGRVTRRGAVEAGRGQVYLAERDRTAFLVHHLNAPAAYPGAELNRFAKLGGQNAAIPKLVDVVRERGMIGLVFAAEDGITLGRMMAHMQRERLADAAVWYIGAELMGALAHCHALRDAAGRSAPVVHGRLSAHSVLATWAGSVRLMGLCPLVAIEYPDDEQAPPSPAWIAPELRTGSPASPQSDLYAAALLVRTLLTASPPALGGTMASLASVRPDLPGDVIALLDRALEPFARDRQTSCAELEQRFASLALASRGHKALKGAMATLQEMSGAWSVGRSAGPDDGTAPSASPAPPQPFGLAEAALEDSGDETIIRGVYDEPTETIGAAHPGAASPQAPPKPKNVLATADHDLGATLIIEERDEPVPAPNEREQVGRARPPTAPSATRTTTQLGLRVPSFSSPRAQEPPPARSPAPVFAAAPAPVFAAAPAPGFAAAPAPEFAAAPAPGFAAAPAPGFAAAPAPEFAAAPAPEFAAAPAPGFAAALVPAVPEAGAPLVAADPNAPKVAATKGRGRIVFGILALAAGGAAALVIGVERGVEHLASESARASASATPPAEVAPPATTPSQNPTSAQAVVPAAASPQASAEASPEPSAVASPEPSAVASPEPSAEPSAVVAPTASPIASASLAPPSARADDSALPKLLNYEAYLTVKSPVDAGVYVQGVPVGRTNTKMVARCRWRNIRLGNAPGPTWISPPFVEYLPCMGAHEITIVPK